MRFKHAMARGAALSAREAAYGALTTALSQSPIFCLRGAPNGVPSGLMAPRQEPPSKIWSKNARGLHSISSQFFSKFFQISILFCTLKKL
jgi:hypothetical protein